MGLTLYDFSGRHEADTVTSLREILQRRYGPSVNGFWISHNDDPNPVLSLLVKDDLATLVYIPSEAHPGFVPISRICELSMEEFTTFRSETIEQELEVPNSQVVLFADAERAVEDFFESKELPKSLDWFEL